jgi:hypothetical protein
MMAPNSHHLIQISIVEEYRIFRTINLDKNDDFVYSIPFSDVEYFIPRIAPPVSILLLLYLKKNNTMNIDDTSLLIQK